MRSHRPASLLRCQKTHKAPMSQILPRRRPSAIDHESNPTDLDDGGACHDASSCTPETVTPAPSSPTIKHGSQWGQGVVAMQRSSPLEPLGSGTHRIPVLILLARQAVVVPPSNAVVTIVTNASALEAARRPHRLRRPRPSARSAAAPVATSDVRCPGHCVPAGPEAILGRPPGFRDRAFDGALGKESAPPAAGRSDSPEK